MPKYNVFNFSQLTTYTVLVFWPKQTSH